LSKKCWSLSKKFKPVSACHRETIGLMLTNFRVGDRVEDKKQARPRPLGAWVSYAIIAAPMIAILSHSEINVDPLLRWILYTIIALTAILPSRF
jgi:hypothetical protein